MLLRVLSLLVGKNGDEDEEEELERLVFKFGDHKTEVEAKLLTIGIELDYKEEKLKQNNV